MEVGKINNFLLSKSLTTGIVFLLIVISIIPTSTSFSSFDDTTPPITTISFDGTLGNNNWYVSNVNVTLYAVDDNSGVKETFYKINDGEWQLYTEIFNVSNEGINNVYYYSVDNAGNTENTIFTELKIDRTDPIVELIYEFKDNHIYHLINFVAVTQDKISGIEKVEFYFFSDLKGVDYDYPYEILLCPSANVKVFGFIFPPTVDIDVRFRSIYIGFYGYWSKVWAPSCVAYDKAGNHAYDMIFGQPEFPSGWSKFENIILPKNYTGNIGRFFINANFIFGED